MIDPGLQVLLDKAQAKRPKINMLALARQDEALMSCIKAPEGHFLASRDVVSLEPTITCYYSKDRNYHYAVFGGVGKAPYYNNQGVLMIDDIYLMYASVLPATKDKLREAFESMKFNGKSFVEQWLEDREVVTAALKKSIRVLAKICVLGLGYGMGMKKLQYTMIEAGFPATYEDAKRAWLAYWALFASVKALSDRVGRMVEDRGYLVNDFGFRGSPDKHKAFNWLIQSSASGVLDTYTEIICRLDERVTPILYIHDELILTATKEIMPEVRTITDKGVDMLNMGLGWDVEFRFNWVEGPTFYHTH